MAKFEVVGIYQESQINNDGHQVSNWISSDPKMNTGAWFTYENREDAQKMADQINLTSFVTRVQGSFIQARTFFIVREG